MWRRLILLAVAAAVPACGGGSGADSAPAATNQETFNDPGILTFPDEGRVHVPVGTDIHYNTDPPTSGPHYPDPEPGGFYTTEIAAGFLVHSMEHGGIIIYYNAAMLTAPELDQLKALADAHPGDFSQVVVVPRADPTYPIILTAWTHMLQLTTFDIDRINNFINLFIGKGPENT